MSDQPQFEVTLNRGNFQVLFMYDCGTISLFRYCSPSEQFPKIGSWLEGDCPHGIPICTHILVNTCRLTGESEAGDLYIFKELGDA